MTRFFEMAVKGRVQRLKESEGLSDDEIRWALDEVERICQLEWPNADYTVSPIDCTDGTWHRQKPEGAAFRTILSIHRDTQRIVVQAILRRDTNTYRKVELIFQQSRDK
jgi:hypothetical protein